MHVDAPDRRYRDELIDPFKLLAWASDFDIERGSPGFGATVEGVLHGALGKERHDLVVPMASAMAFSGRVPVLHCPHVHYFRTPDVRQAIRAFFAAAAPAAAGAATNESGVIAADPGTVSRALKRNADEFKARNKP